MTVKCEFPYAGPNCDQTYAEHLGATFDNFTYGFAAILVVLGLLTFFFTAVVFKRKGFKQLDTQKSMWLISCAMGVTLAIRAPDLEGFKMAMPYVVFLLPADIGSALLYSLVFTLLHDWVNVVMYVSGRARYERRINYLFYFLNGLIWVSYIPLSILQAQHHETWLWRAIKFVISAIALLIIVVLQSVFGYFIFNTLAKNERRGVTPVHVRQASRGNTTEVSKIPERSEREDSESEASVSVPGPSRLARETSPSDETGAPGPRGLHHKQSSISSIGTPNIPQNIQNRSNVRKQKSRVHRIKWLLVIYGVCETGVLLAQLNTAYTLYTEKDTKSSLVTPPDGLLDLLYATVFDWIHLVAMLMLIIFFRPRFKKEHKEPTPPPRAPISVTERKKSQASIFSPTKQASRHQLQVELVVRDEPRDNEAVLAALSGRGSVTQNAGLNPSEFTRAQSLNSLSSANDTDALLSPPAGTASPSAGSTHSNLLSPLIIPQPSSSGSLLTPSSANSDNNDDQNIPALALSQAANQGARYPHHTFSHSQSQSVHISMNHEAGGNNDSQPLIHSSVNRRPSFPVSFVNTDRFEPVVESPRPAASQAASAEPPNGQPTVSNDPDDWEQFETEQGVPYYYSERRRSSQWERPSSPRE